MSKSPSSPQSFQPLSIGNVVSAGLRLYRDRFKLYFSLAIGALLWALVPIYGWAKNYQIQAIISRQAYKDLINQPEPISTTRTQLDYRFWSFWAAQILIVLMGLAVYLGSSIILGVIFFIPNLILSNVTIQNSETSLINLVIEIVYWLISFIVSLWFYSHFFISELPLAIENKMNSTNSLGRSWELSSGLVFRVQLIVLVAGLMTAPIVLLTLIPVFFIVPVFVTSSSQDVILVSYFLISFLGMISGIVGTTVMMPFWQTIKAVIYYDIRSRREGLGLQVRDSLGDSSFQ